MPRRFVDLSIFLENDVLSDPPAFAPKIQYFNHENTFAQIEPFFPGLQKQDLPDGEGWAVEMVQLSTHNGTHLDAPYHFHSTMDKALGDKKPAIAIHEVPLEWCFQPGIKLDFRHLADRRRPAGGRRTASVSAPARAAARAVTALLTYSRCHVIEGISKPCPADSSTCPSISRMTSPAIRRR